MKAVLYCRVSTNKQEAENQLIQLRNYCNKMDYEVTHEFIDIISGKETSRPEYDKMFKCARKKLFDMVIFWDISRFSRAGTLHTLQKLKELDNLKIQWHSYQDPYLSSVGDFKDVVISILSTLAKIEREKISERTKAGLDRARLDGKCLGRPLGKKDKKSRKSRNDRGVKRGNNKINHAGYVETKGKQKLHRLIMERKIGRELKPEEIVHHIDENKLNNHPDNLQLFSNKSEHTRFHWNKKGYSK